MTGSSKLGPPPPAERLVFVCAGNICRSLLAARLYARAAGEPGLPVLSRGLIANPGEGPTEPTIRVAREAGIDVADHRAVRFAPDEVRPGDLILVMEHAQRDEILARTGHAPAAVRLLGCFAPDHPDEVDDPGEGEVTWQGFLDCIAHVEAAVTGLARWLGR